MRAADANGVEGATSAAATGTTTGTAATRHLPTRQQLRPAGVAPPRSGGYTYASGSNQNMGLWEHLHHHHAEDDGPQLLRDWHLPDAPATLERP